MFIFESIVGLLDAVASQLHAQRSAKQRPENVRRMTLRLHSFWNANRCFDGSRIFETLRGSNWLRRWELTGFQYGYPNRARPTLITSQIVRPGAPPQNNTQRFLTLP